MSNTTGHGQGSDPRPCEYTHRGDAERTAIVEDAAAEGAQIEAELDTEADDDPGAVSWQQIEAALLPEADDPGPVPAIVEPESPEVTTIPVTPRTHVEITRRGACTRLTVVSVNAGARLATDMPPQAVDALVWALVTHTPAPQVIVPALPEEVGR